MQALMIASILMSTIVGTIVGMKLLILASRTRRLPELAVGGALFCYAAVAQTALFVSSSLGPDASHGHHMALLALRLVAYYLTLVGLAVFTWRVFGAESRWRLALTVFIAVSTILTVGAAYWASWHQLGIDDQLPLYARFGASPQYGIVFAWISVESLHYSGLMRKRQSLGLADAVVTNRFVVWGLAAGASAFLIAGVLFVQLSRNVLLGEDHLSSALISATGLVNTIGWWLTFMPPAAYTRWVRGPSASAGSRG